VNDGTALYRLSLADPAAGVVLEDHDAGGGYNRAIDATGARIALASGQVLRTGSFVEEGQIPTGALAASGFGDRFAVARADGNVEFYDPFSLQRTGSTNSECLLQNAPHRLHSMNADNEFILLAADQLCLALSLPRSTPPAYPSLRFSDLALEACVLATAQAEAWTEPEEFMHLDCSGSAQAIASLDGIQNLANLARLDISGSDVFDLAPLTGLNFLTEIVARNTPLASAGLLTANDALTSLDVTGSSNVTCADLDLLAQENGVNVSADLCAEDMVLELGGIGFDLELDDANERVFVSIPATRTILEIDLATFASARTLGTSAEPRGIDLAADGATLYAAFNNIGTLAYIDPETGVEQLVDLTAELGDSRTYDVVEVSPDRILVSSSPYSNGFAYIVEVRRDLGNAAQRVAGDRIIRAAPQMQVSADGQSVYVREGFSPSSMYKLDASDAMFPIIAEDAHGAVDDSSNPALSPDGTLLITRSGQLYRTANIRQAGRVAAGLSTFSVSGAAIFVAEPTLDGVGVYDAQTLRKVAQRYWGCGLQTATQLVQRANGELLVLGDDLLCTTRVTAY
jgi:hypothetical protein